MAAWCPPGIYARQTLSDVADRLGGTEKARHERGIHVKRGHPPTLLTDEQVLECRALHEFEGVKLVTLARRYGVERDYMRKLLDYEVRSRLIPNKSTPRGNDAR